MDLKYFKIKYIMFYRFTIHMYVMNYKGVGKLAGKFKSE